VSRFAALVAAAAAVVVTAGCGVGTSDEGRVAAVTGDYLTALADGDYAAACSALAPAAKPEGDCAEGVAASLADIRADAIAADDEGKIEIDVHGESATVTLESGATLQLVRTGGEWLVTEPYGG
jgi:hypothetical protein